VTYLVVLIFDAYILVGLFIVVINEKCVSNVKKII